MGRGEIAGGLPKRLFLGQKRACGQAFWCFPGWGRFALVLRPTPEVFQRPPCPRRRRGAGHDALDVRPGGAAGVHPPVLPVPGRRAARQAGKVSIEAGWGQPRAPQAPLTQRPRVPPARSRDFYHTCYCLSGLAIAQHFGSGNLHQEVVLGVPENRLVGAGIAWGGAGGWVGHPPGPVSGAFSSPPAAAHASRLQHPPGEGGEGGAALLAAARARPGGGGLRAPLLSDGAAEQSEVLRVLARPKKKSCRPPGGS